MTPKSGTAGTLDSPEAPEKAKEAAKAEPGEVDAGEAKPGGKTPGKWSSTTVPATGGDSEDEESRNSWISLELKDARGKPIPDEPFDLKLPDGTITSGVLDAKGKRKVEGIPSGQCEVRFPRLHNTEWRRA